MTVRAPAQVAAVIAAMLASLAFIDAPAVARDQGGPALSHHRGSALHVSDKRTNHGKRHAHAHRGNKGGHERGLVRADAVAGSHGDLGRDRAASNRRR